MFAHTSGGFLTLSLCWVPVWAPAAGITEVLDPKGLREGINRQNTYWEGQKADDQLAKFYFSQQALYKRKKDLTSKTLWPSYNFSVFATLHSYCQCPWLSINFFSVKGNHLVFLPTVTETWCTCGFWPCWNAAKPQWPCQTVDFGS
jgi:hypothetical protein